MLRLFKKKRTVDKMENDILVAQKLGAKQSLTPEGFLLCEDVPIKRIGTMMYGPGEVPITPGQNGIAYVTRDAATLFSPATIASYNGKPVVDEHPHDGVVDAKNWKRLAVGVCFNVRQGVGDDADVLLADLLITDQNAIQAVQAGKREVSAGYDADYEQVGEGAGRQTNIIGNHVALVQRGRCGPRCAIGDHVPQSLQEMPMGTKTTERRRLTPSVAEAIRKTFRDAELAALEQLGSSGLPSDEELMGGDDGSGADGNHTHIHIHSGGAGEAVPPSNIPMPTEGAGAPMPTSEDSMEARVAALEASVGQILSLLQGGGEEPMSDEGGDPTMGGEDLPPEEGDLPAAEGEASAAEAEDTPPADDSGSDDSSKTKDTMTKDSAALQTAYQRMVSDAEVLLPGFRPPTFDAATTRRATIDNMCATRRGVLSTLLYTTDGKTLVETVNGGARFNVATATCDVVARVFSAAAGAKRLLNNRMATADAGQLPNANPAAKPKQGVSSLSAWNAANRAYWDQQRAKHAAAQK